MTERVKRREDRIRKLEEKGKVSATILQSYMDSERKSTRRHLDRMEAKTHELHDAKKAPPVASRSTQVAQSDLNGLKPVHQAIQCCFNDDVVKANTRAQQLNEGLLQLIEKMTRDN